MKTSKKILLGTAVFVLILQVVALFVLREDVKSLAIQNKSTINYKPIEVAPFSQVNISAFWDVKIRQGRMHLVELGEVDLIDDLIEIEVKDGVLYFKKDTVNTRSASRYYARVTLPILEAIDVENDTHIELIKFVGDSIKLNMNGGGTFLSTENKVKYFDIQSTGDAQIKMAADPYQ